MTPVPGVGLMLLTGLLTIIAWYRRNKLFEAGKHVVGARSAPDAPPQSRSARCGPTSQSESTHTTVDLGLTQGSERVTPTGDTPCSWPQTYRCFLICCSKMFVAQVPTNPDVARQADRFPAQLQLLQATSGPVRRSKVRSKV